MQIAHIQTTTETVFATIDAEGNNRGSQTATGGIAAITPLAFMELYEKLHAARNDLRVKVGLEEIATPDEGLLVLAFLRSVSQVREGGLMPDLAELERMFRDVVQQVQEERLDGLLPRAQLTEEEWQRIKEHAKRIGEPFPIGENAAMEEER